MTVAYVLTEFPSLTETFVSAEVRLLRARGVTVVPFSLRAPRFPGDPTVAAEVGWRGQGPTHGEGLRALRRFGSGARATALEFIESQRVAPLEWAFALAVLPKAAAIAARCRTLGVTHVHTHFERGAAILAALVGALAERPWSFTAHAFGLWTSHPEALRERVRRAAFVRSPHSAATIAIRALEPAARVLEVVTPLELDRLPQRRQPDGTLLAIARAVPKKGLDLLPGLVDHLRRRGVAVRPRVIGPGGEPLPHTETLKALAGASLFVAPCRVAPNGDRDGLPLALLEAVAIGVPAFATRMAGIPDLMAPHLSEHLAETEDVVQLSDRIARALSQPERLRDRVDAAREDARRRYGPEVLEPLGAAFAQP